MKFVSLLLVTGFLSFSLSFSSCTEKADAGNQKISAAAAEKLPDPFVPNEAWKSYWYAGKAEVNSYAINQGRYGDAHPGNAVNIFVTEDFSAQKQVKLDQPSRAGADRLPVLKLNQSIKFNTGIYPYSVMLSTFSPIDVNRQPHAVKVASTIQEWCGMVYTQANLQQNGLQVKQYSYFESEGDKESSFSGTWMEDELWSLIRISPDHLPVGNMDIIPGTMYLRFAHHEIKPYQVSLSLQKGDVTSVYSISYPGLKRTLNITFNTEFPYQITGWEESYLGFGGKQLNTKATLLNSQMLDYWSMNGLNDRYLRETLGLPKDSQ